MSQGEPLFYVLRAEFGDPDREEKWNAWYDDVHVPELLTVPGIISAARYQERDSHRYLAVYEIESLDVFDEPRYREITGWGRWADSIVSYSRAVVLTYQQLGPVPQR